VDLEAHYIMLWRLQWLYNFAGQLYLAMAQNQELLMFCPPFHCETRRVGKDDGKGWNVIIPPESVVFWPIVISHLLSGEGNSTN